MRRETSLYLDQDFTRGMDKQEVLKALKIAFASTQVHVAENRNVFLAGPTDEYILLDSEITQSIKALGISPERYDRAYHCGLGKVDFCLEDSFTGLFLSQIIFATTTTDWVIIHLDDHADLMPAILLRQLSGTLIDPAANRFFYCKDPEHWHEGIASGSVNIGNYFTPLLHQLTAGTRIHIRHIRPTPNHATRDQILSLEASTVRYPILGDTRFAAITSGSFHPKKSTYMQTVSPIKAMENLPDGQIAVHIDLDFFINDFNGNAGTVPTTLSQSDRTGILTTIDSVFEQISHIDRPVMRWIIAASPGFCAARHWPWLLDEIGLRINQLDDNIGGCLPWNQ